MPIINLGKQREALVGSAEFYKKKVIEYLEAKGYYPKMDSFVEGTLADCILSRKNEESEYWLESKAMIVSLGDARFVSELGKYLTAYLVRSPEKRFKMKLAVQGYRKADLFRKLYERFDESAIKQLLQSMLDVMDETDKKVIRDADPKEIKKFFEDTEVIRAATTQDLQDAIEQIYPKPPVKPKLTDAKYASDILERYQTNQPIEGEDVLSANLFVLKLPPTIYIAETPYNSEQEIARDSPELLLPPIRVVGGKTYSFNEITPKSSLGVALKLNFAAKVDVSGWVVSEENRNIALYLLYRWIEELTEKKGLSYDSRTERYYFSEYTLRQFAKTIRWKSQRMNTRDVITPVKREDGRVYYYAHRAVKCLIRNLWGEFFIQLIPGWVFTGDCYTPYPGSISDILDRAYRKSVFTRNKNQLNDVLSWSKFLFAEGVAPIEGYLNPQTRNKSLALIQVSEQLTALAHSKPNVSDDEGEEETETVSADQLLDSFFEDTEED